MLLTANAEAPALQRQLLITANEDEASCAFLTARSGAATPSMPVTPDDTPHQGQRKVDLNLVLNASAARASNPKSAPTATNPLPRSR